MYIFYTNFCLEKEISKEFSKKFQKSEAEMCLAMCLKKQEFQADCVYKHCVYKKKVCILSKLKKVSFTYNFFFRINKCSEIGTSLYLSNAEWRNIPIFLKD